LDKLLKHYISEFQPEDLMTSVDLEWSSGQAFRQLGFEEIGRTEPNVFLVNTQNLVRFYPARFTPEMKQALKSDNPEEELRTMGFAVVRNRGNVRLARW
jgi:hypothetical protein